jgi:hypothetical protein
MANCKNKEKKLETFKAKLLKKKNSIYIYFAGKRVGKSSSQ